MSDNRITAVETFFACFAIASAGGLAEKLRRGGKVTLRELFASALYSGLVGLVIGLMWNNYWEANPYFIIGVSGLAGLGGVSFLDVVVQLISRNGIDITIRPKDDHTPLE